MPLLSFSQSTGRGAQLVSKLLLGGGHIDHQTHEAQTFSVQLLNVGHHALQGLGRVFPRDHRQVLSGTSHLNNLRSGLAHLSAKTDPGVHHLDHGITSSLSRNASLFQLILVPLKLLFGVARILANNTHGHTEGLNPTGVACGVLQVVEGQLHPSHSHQRPE